MPDGRHLDAKVAVQESQIVAILKEGEARMPVAEILRKHGMSVCRPTVAENNFDA